MSLNPDPVFKAEGLTKTYGGLTAVDGVDFEIRDEILGLIGPNGAGKTTMVNCLTGVESPSSGTVRFKDEDVTNMASHQISKRGISRSFQQVTLFRGLTVFENLLTALQEHEKGSVVDTFRKHTDEERKLADEMVSFLGLEDLRDTEVQNLSYGQQKLVDFGMATISDPEIVFLDEPAAGVNPSMIENIKENIYEEHEAGLSIVIVEHNIDLVMEICSRLIVLNNGQVLSEGPPERIQEDQRVIEAYYGG